MHGGVRGSAPIVARGISRPFHEARALAPSKLAEGTPWDALATLRRMIEMHLQDLARRHDVQLPERIGAGKLLDLLRRNRIVPDGTARACASASMWRTKPFMALMLA
jgi:hypothetical protein